MLKETYDARVTPASYIQGVIATNATARTTIQMHAANQKVAKEREKENRAKEKVKAKPAMNDYP